ncbi:AAA family ATPase [Streptomyces muensis]|uniref:ATP-binding protein n=1 Tax=Streptomyces muensis TaxID=1077944 RepID=A0A9X1TMV0_STRM4|nr:ATP-binding protein [Streptomyces muensis]MCF1596485.1 ATP-binding protein [Streptomyces muensis]
MGASVIDALRGPTPPPEVPVPFVGRDQEVEELAAVLAERSPRVLVLHGPVGVGKSALAAALVERVGFGRGPVHWLSLDGNATEETILLRLLAEHGAPRRPILTAAVRAENAGEDLLFASLLSEQARKYVRDSVIVLDGAHPSLRRLLHGLLPQRGDGPRLVIVTSRSDMWRGPRMHVHEVRPLDTPDAVRLIEDMSRLVEPAQDPDPARLARAARGLPAWLRVAGALPPGPHDTPHDLIASPDALLELATSRLDPAAVVVLRCLALREPNTAPFSVRTVEALLPDFGGPYDAPGILSVLGAYELVGTVREGLWTLPSCVADAVQRDIGPGDHYSLRVQVVEQQRKAALNSAWHAVHPLDGRPKWFRSDLAPMDLPTHIDEFMALLDRHRSPETLPETLAAFLAVRGDAHRLVAVHRLSGGRARLGLSQLLRDVGALKEAEQVLADESFQRGSTPTMLVRGEAQYSAGDLIGVGSARVTATPHIEAGLSVVRGAALCDRGQPLKAAHELDAAAEAHRRNGCVRGRGWALLHQARACLLLNRPLQAEHRLAQAAKALRDVGDVRGLNWVATERIRLLLLRDDAHAALAAAQRALTAHEQAEDVRGMGWTGHHVGLVLVRQDRITEAGVALRSAADYFEGCGDRLGAAWTRHRLALLAQNNVDHQVRELEGSLRAFAEAGCDTGQAWSLLELALRTRRSALGRSNEFLAGAVNLFENLDDLGGLMWAHTVDHLPAARLRSSAPWRSLVARANSSEALEADLSAFWHTATEGGHPVIPLHARDTVALPTRDDKPERKPLAPYVTPARRQPTTPRCHVRLTLLDDSPAAHATARLLLRVAPEKGHPWRSADDERPWLTAVAVPLTPATVEPPTALLLPSRQQAHGAEFDVTAHRPGVHVIRFTIALERTGTVLQQVETELEILDGTDGADLAAPHAAFPRER